jgi:hypothetical protein
MAFMWCYVAQGSDFGEIRKKAGMVLGRSTRPGPVNVPILLGFLYQD